MTQHQRNWIEDFEAGLLTDEELAVYVGISDMIKAGIQLTTSEWLDSRPDFREIWIQLTELKQRVMLASVAGIFGQLGLANTLLMQDRKPSLESLYSLYRSGGYING